MADTQIFSIVQSADQSNYTLSIDATDAANAGTYELSILECENQITLPDECLTDNKQRTAIEIIIIPCDAEYGPTPPTLDLKYMLGEPAIVLQYKTADVSSCS